jgi:hypothetical protein
MKNALLIISIFLNIGLSVLYYFKTKPMQEKSSAIPVNNMDTVDYEITSMKNFEAVYFNRNDSLYKDLWSEAFENEPEKAFLIPCSYFYTTKDEKVLNDIKVSAEQLETAYQRKSK